MDQEPPRGKSGRYQAGQSGNPRGRPRRQDAADQPPTTAIARTAPAEIRRDGWRNAQSGHGTARDRRTLTTYGVDVVTDIEAQQLRRSEFLAAAIIEQGPKEALKRPWSLKCEDKEVANAIRKQAEALGLDQVLYDAWTKENEAGGAAIFPVISGAQGDLSMPLDEKAIASVDAFHVFEPQELTPTAYYTDIRSPKFRRPSAYRLQPITSGRGGYMPMTVIHETRLVIFPGLQTTMQTQPGQREGWGDSRLCRPRQVMADFGLAWGSAATLLHNHGKETLEMDGLAQMLSQADGLEEFDRHIAAMQMAWSTLRMNTIDGKSKISRSTGTLAGVSDLLNEFKSLMAAAAERPVSILMGVGSTGLRTGDDDTRAWYSTVERETSQHLKPRHEHIIRLQLLATSGPTGGVEPESWSVEYPPLWSPSEKETAETRKLDMDRAKIAIEIGVASADDVAESFFKGDTYSGDIVVDWDRRAAQGKIDAEQAAQIEDDRGAMQALGREQPKSATQVGDHLALDSEDDAIDDDPELEDIEDEDIDPDDDDEGWSDDDTSDGDPGLRLDRYNSSQPRGKDGKFGSGGGSGRKVSAKAVVKAGDRVVRTGDRVAKHGARLEATKAARDKAHGRASSAIAKAKASSEKAKAAPTERNVKAAKFATARAGKAVIQLEKHDNRVDRHTAAHEKAQAAHADARAKLHEVSGHAAGHKATADQAEKAVIANGLIGPASGGSAHPEFTPMAQAAIRDRARSELAGHGIMPRDPHEVGRASIGVRNLGSATANYITDTGHVNLSPDTARNLAEYHKGDPRALGEAVRNGDQSAYGKIYAHHAVVHEQLHASGPAYRYHGPGVLGEEMATEMSARMITGHTHGFAPELLGNGPYHWVLNPAISHIATASRKTYSEAHAALGRAALEHKSGKLTRGQLSGNVIHGENVLHNLATSALQHLGVHDAHAHITAYNEFTRISKEM